MDAEAMLEAIRGGDAPLGIAEPALNLDRAVHGVDGAREEHHQAIAGVLHDLVARE